MTIARSQSEPYRVFFPLGLALAWAGVLHWLLLGLGVLATYRAVFHSIVQIQGFLTCFAVGMLLTAVPRRTGTAPPATWEIAVGVVATVGTTVAAWLQRWALSQLLWLALVVVLVRFLVVRFLDPAARRRPPNEFLWLPLALGMGVAGSLLLAAYGILGARYLPLHYLGKLLLLQGMFLGLVIGMGALAFRVVTRGDGPPDAAASADDDAIRAAHVLGALLLVVTFVVETFASRPAGLWLRALVVLALLLLSGRLWRPPSLRGWHRSVVWVSGFLLPAGYVLAAAFPAHYKAGLHVVFLGGFALLALSVALHVVLSDGGHVALAAGRPWQVAAYGLLLLGAAVMRALVDFDRARFALWLTASAAAFLAGTVAWGWLALPRMWEQGR